MCEFYRYFLLLPLIALPVLLLFRLVSKRIFITLFLYFVIALFTDVCFPKFNFSPVFSIILVALTYLFAVAYEHLRSRSHCYDKAVVLHIDDNCKCFMFSGNKIIKSTLLSDENIKAGDIVKYYNGK